MRSGPWQVASDLHVPDGVTVGIGGAEQVHGRQGSLPQGLRRLQACPYCWYGEEMKASHTPRSKLQKPH